MSKPSDLDGASVVVGEIMASIDEYVKEFAWAMLLTGDPLRPLTIAGYRRELRNFALGELAAGRYGVETDDRPPY